MGAFDSLQLMTRLSWKKKNPAKRKGTCPCKYCSCGQGKGKGKPAPRRPSPAKSRQTSSGPMRGRVAHGERAPIKSRQCLLCRQMGHFDRDRPNRGSRDENHSNLKHVFGSFAGMVRDWSATLITKLGTKKEKHTETETHRVVRNTLF